MDQKLQAKTCAVILKTYFGTKQGETTADFIKKLRALSTEEKEELAILAAKELGFEVSDLKVKAA